MNLRPFPDSIITTDDLILITGASGFIGRAVLERLAAYGFRNLRCLVRPSGDTTALKGIGAGAPLDIVRGNLLSRQDCFRATENASVIYHLAAGTGTSSYPDAFMNSVVTTRNLLETSAQHKCLKRFVSVSSFAVYTNNGKSRREVLDESSAVEERPHLRGDAYCFAKAKQDALVMEYGKKLGIPYVIVRPGVVYGPGKRQLIGRVGLGTFGIFLHLGGSNKIPLTYVDNCAEAIVLAGLRHGVEGEVFNIVDDDLPSSRQVLRLYKQNAEAIRSIYIPRWASYLLFYLWEKYSTWSHDQLPPVFNRKAWRAYWKGSNYSNEKLKRRLGWSQTISTAEGLKRYLESCAERHA